MLEGSAAHESLAARLPKSIEPHAVALGRAAP
jgi:hypothetical protein